MSPTQPELLVILKIPVLKSSLNVTLSKNMAYICKFYYLLVKLIFSSIIYSFYFTQINSICQNTMIVKTYVDIYLVSKTKN